MISVKDLEFMCKRLAFEYGDDAKVCVRVVDEDENIIGSDYARSFNIGKDGTLYISNKPEKED